MYDWTKQAKEVKIRQLWPPWLCPFYYGAVVLVAPSVAPAAGNWFPAQECGEWRDPQFLLNTMHPSYDEYPHNIQWRGGPTTAFFYATLKAKKMLSNFRDLCIPSKPAIDEDS